MALAAGGGGGSGGGRTAEPQPELQAWLELQGLTAADADWHARRLARIFGGDQQAALASLPATFEFCRSRGLSGLESARLLDRIAQKRHENVVSFATTAQLDWLQMDGCIAAYVRRRQQAGERLPKHASLASLLRQDGSTDAAQALASPRRVADWVKALSALLPDAADVGRLLLGKPQAARTPPETTLAVLRWFVEALGVPPAELAGYAARGSAVLNYKAATLQEKLAALQAALPPEQAQRLARQHPSLLGYHSVTIREALAWLMQAFGGDAERVLAVVDRVPQLLTVSQASLERRAEHLQRQHGWRRVRGHTGQLTAWIEAHPSAFAESDFGSPDRQAVQLLYTGVLGLDEAGCATRWSSYLSRGLPRTAARYVLLQARRGPAGLCFRCQRRRRRRPGERRRLLASGAAVSSTAPVSTQPFHSSAPTAPQPPAPGARALAAVQPWRHALAGLGQEHTRAAGRRHCRHRGGGHPA